MTERGWDRFLTDRDKAVLEASGRTRSVPYGLGTRPALIMVDIYLAALGERGVPIEEAVGRWPMACGDAGWDAVDVAAEVLETARHSSIPVVHVTMLDFPSPWARGALGAAAQATGEAFDGAYEIVADVAPRPGELVIRKTAPSAFRGTPLSFHLNFLGIDSVVVCGESTSGCVRATVVDAVTERLKVGVVEDACFDRTEASHWINLFDMHQKYGDVMTSHDAREYLSSVGGTGPGRT